MDIENIDLTEITDKEEREKIIAACLVADGGFTKKTVNRFGLYWRELKKGWKNDLINNGFRPPVTERPAKKANKAKRAKKVDNNPKPASINVEAVLKENEKLKEIIEIYEREMEFFKRTLEKTFQNNQ